jgi:hypothetical protein
MEASYRRKEKPERFISDIEELAKSFFEKTNNPIEGIQKHALAAEIANGAIENLTKFIAARNFKGLETPGRWCSMTIALCFYYTAQFKKISKIVEHNADTVLFTLSRCISDAYIKNILRIFATFKKLSNSAFKKSYHNKVQSRIDTFEKIWLDKNKSDPDWVKNTKKATQRVRDIIQMIDSRETVTERTGLKYLRVIEKKHKDGKD